MLKNNVELTVAIVNECNHASLIIDDASGRQLNVSLADGVDGYVAREVNKYIAVYDEPRLVGDVVVVDIVNECIKRELT